MPASCSDLTIALNSGTCWPRSPAAEYSLCGREEPDRVVAPVVAQALVQEGGVVDELVHRHQFDRRHPDSLEVGDHGRMGDTGVRAAVLLGHLGMQSGQTLHVCLVDDRLGVRGSRVTVAASSRRTG